MSRPVSLLAAAAIVLTTAPSGCEPSDCRRVGAVSARSIRSQHAVLIEGSPGNQRCWIEVSGLAWLNCRVGRSYPDCANIEV